LTGIQCVRRQFLKRTQANAIGLAQGPIDCPGFGHPHLGVVEDQWGDIPWMGIAKADEASTLGGLKDGGLENPKVFSGRHRGSTASA
jgi:hypothetical protein